MWLSSLGAQHCTGTKGWLRALVLSLFQSQDFDFCTPIAFDCYTTIAKNITGCDVSCTGLYADVQFTEDKVLSQTLREDIQTVKASIEVLKGMHRADKQELAADIKMVAAAGKKLGYFFLKKKILRHKCCTTYWPEGRRPGLTRIW